MHRPRGFAAGVPGDQNSSPDELMVARRRYHKYRPAASHDHFLRQGEGGAARRILRVPLTEDDEIGEPAVMGYVRCRVPFDEMPIASQTGVIELLAELGLGPLSRLAG